jgi:hypothetical protein
LSGHAKIGRFAPATQRKAFAEHLKLFSEPLEAERWAKKQLAAKLAGLD